MMTKRRYAIVALIALVFLLYTILFNMSPTAIEATDLMPFDPDGFTDSETLSDTDRLVAENATFQLYLDETTSYFRLVDKRTGLEWKSNPDTFDPWQFDPTKTITNSALDKQRSTLELSYFNDTGSIATINNYKYSIHHPESILNDEGLRTFGVKYVDDGFQIKYVIEDLEIDYLYFPKFLTPDVLESLDNRDILEAIAYTGYDEELDVYELVQYESMSKLVKRRLYDTFYGEDGLGYTRERAIEENAQYGYTETFEKVRFEIALDVRLTDDGIDVTIPHDSIVEPSNVKLARITVLPLFGTAISEIAGEPTDGYIVLPDGSGAVMEFNNGKFYQQPYNKRLYGEDLAILDYKMPEVQEKISLPLFGMVKDTGGYAAIITEGDSMATLHADVSGRIDSYNKVYTSFLLREVESVTLGTGFNQYGIDLWTKERVRSDFQISFRMLDDTENDYVSIAAVYRDHLETTRGFRHDDTTTSTVVTAELVGAYDQKQFLLGVPYYANDSLTTFDEAETILNALNDAGITTIDVLYTGMINGGLSTDLNDHFNVERVLGGRRGYRDFLAYLDDADIVMYPTVKLMTASEFDKMFDRFRYSASRIDGSQSLLFNYHLPSKLPYSETPFGDTKDDYVINPRYLAEVLSRFDKDYDGDAIAFELLGGVLGGDYDNAVLVYRQDALRLQEELLAGLDEQLALSSPLGFAMPYATTITDLPTDMTLYAILDYPIPLLQLVLSGQVDYSTVSLNLANTRSTQFNFLKIIETGSNVKYTLSFDDSKELKETEYNYYLSTQYQNWLTQIAQTVAELDDLGIHQGTLIGHRVLANNVVEVSYSHGLVVRINYNLSDVTVDSQTIPALDYVVVEVD